MKIALYSVLRYVPSLARFLTYAVLAYVAAWSLSFVGGKALDVYDARVRAEENTIEWQEKQLKWVLLIEKRILTSSARCNDMKNTLELLRTHEYERQRYWRVVLRYASGQQYQGVEKTLPQPITQIDCGVWII